MMHLQIDKYIFPEDYPQLHIKGLEVICEEADEILNEVYKKFE